MSTPESIEQDASLNDDRPRECVDCETEIERETTFSFRGKDRCWACHGHEVLHASESLTISSSDLLDFARELEAVVETMEREAAHRLALEELDPGADADPGADPAGAVRGVPARPRRRDAGQQHGAAHRREGLTMATRMQAYAVALDALADDLLAKGENAEVYVMDKGSEWAREFTLRTRYEAGIVAGLGGIRFRTAGVYGESWAGLVANLRALPAVRRSGYASAWRLAAFDALAAGACPLVVAEQSMQLQRWIDNGSEPA